MPLPQARPTTRAMERWIDGLRVVMDLPPRGLEVAAGVFDKRRRSGSRLHHSVVASGQVKNDATANQIPQRGGHLPGVNRRQHGGVDDDLVRQIPAALTVLVFVVFGREAESKS